MSVQTGVPAPEGPASSRLVDRAMFQVARLRNEPNAIWIRELRQAARLTRTPFILTVVTIMMTLLIASIGGIMSTTAAPAETGMVLFHVFFSVAYFVVVLVGAAVAANSIASEREGRTWEALLLTGLRPGEIARGKFFAAYTAISMYVVMLAPVGALPFLFGGVTATEVIVAFIFLFLIAWLSVAFGLAVSSKMQSLRGALVITLLLAFVISPMLYSSLGVGLSFAAHKAWPRVAEGAPAWLPSAYDRAPFGWEYVVFLFALPVAVVSLPAWFLYEVTIANLTSVTDDRSTGLKRWLLVTAPILTAIAFAPHIVVSVSDLEDSFSVGMSFLAVFSTFCVFLFLGEPIGPSRRVRASWARARAGRLRRFLGPGVPRTATLLLMVLAASLGAFTLAGLAVIVAGGHSSATVQAQQAILFATYAVTFQVFLIGGGAWLRTRTQSALIARVLMLAVIFGVAVGPWIVAAIAGFISDPSGSSSDLWFVAAPSPFYAFAMMKAASRSETAPILAGLAASAGWLVLGAALLGAARARCSKIVREHEATLDEADRRLAEEDAAATP